MAMFEVIVGNIGMVYSGSDMELSNRMFEDYAIMSKLGSGRVAGENVALLQDGECIRSYNP
jgi:hypothetical protein